MKNYNSEAEGRIDFYKELGYQGNPNEENCNVDYSTNTDGVINGVLFEHKPVINSAAAPLNRVLGQAIKYLSKKRINGIDVPDTIILISQNDEVAYHLEVKIILKRFMNFIILLQATIMIFLLTYQEWKQSNMEKLVLIELKN